MYAIWSEYLPVFLLGFGSLLPLVNPIGTALIVEPYFKWLSQAERKTYAFRIALNCMILGVVSLHIGSRILEFMGVSISATQTAGGIVIAILGYGLLNSKPSAEADSKLKEDISSSVFYPISFPLTIGPGSVSTLIALSANVRDGRPDFFSMKLAVLSLALLVVVVMAYFCFAYNNKISERIGATGNLVLNRLLAFLVFCIGIQMAFNGVMGLIKNSS